MDLMILKCVNNELGVICAMFDRCGFNLQRKKIALKVNSFYDVSEKCCMKCCLVV